MRLYPKKLNSVEELKRERHKLRQKLKVYKEEGVFPGTGKKTSSRSGEHKKDVISSIADFFFNSPFANIALSLGAPLIAKAGKKTGKSVFHIGKELIGGYAKWKAMEIGYRWARRMIQSRKERRDEKAAKK